MLFVMPGRIPERLPVYCYFARIHLSRCDAESVNVTLKVSNDGTELKVAFSNQSGVARRERGLDASPD